MDNSTKKKHKNKDLHEGRADILTRKELESLVSMFAELLGEYIDVIFLMALDDGYLTGKRAYDLIKMQRLARIFAEVFASSGKGGGLS